MASDLLTTRQLRDRLNTIPEEQLDQPVGVYWSDSGQTAYADNVEIEVDTGSVEIIA